MIGRDIATPYARSMRPTKPTSLDAMPLDNESEPSMKRTSVTLASISLQGRTAVENPGRWLPHSDRESFSQFLGASLLSATGSLPQHLGPLIIIAIVADGRIPVSEAGWILSVRAIGELLTSIALPL